MKIEELRERVKDGSCFILDSKRKGKSAHRKLFILNLLKGRALTIREMSEVSDLTIHSLSVLLRRYEQAGLVSAGILGKKQVYFLRSELAKEVDLND